MVFLMKLISTVLKGVYVVETNPFQDKRGSFVRFYCGKELSSAMLGRNIVQINHSRTRAVGAIRGIHFQYPPDAEMKLVRCLKGKIWDVAVDLRTGSPTFLHWHAEELSAKNGRMIVIPEGCAHGFQVLEQNTELLYLHTAPYASESEGGLLFNDPRLNITWPLPAADISTRDRSHPPIPEDFMGLTI